MSVACTPVYFVYKTYVTSFTKTSPKFTRHWCIFCYQQSVNDQIVAPIALRIKAHIRLWKSDTELRKQVAEI